ncbi:Adaptin-N domain-containing protein [Mycena kentingensis (nom. inval.)]|nr:Adaptin-N domain-containing protein [Mycena kentingensis (nom. inval.)]
MQQDLESPSDALVCLALDNLIASPSEDIIPAVQTRLHDLLSNNNPNIRRRAVLAASALSPYESEILRRIADKIYQRIQDPEPNVACAALVASLQLSKVHEPAVKHVQEAIEALLVARPPRTVLLQVLHVLRTVGLLPTQVPHVLEIIQITSKSADHPLMCAAFALLAEADLAAVVAAQATMSLSPASCLRSLINSSSPNDHFIFLSCLSRLDPVLWAGTGDLPAVLDEWEVGRVMKLLDSSDTIIRRKTLHIFGTIDANIIQSYYLQSLQTLPIDLNANALCEYTTRLLEIIETQTDGEGELYGRHIVDLFAQIEARSPRYADIVMENIVEMLLLRARDAAPDFQLACVTIVVTTLAQAEIFIGQTLMVIATALATEFSGKLAVPPRDILRGISTRLGLCSVAVQDACLLAMLRVSAECEEVPPEVLQIVADLRTKAKRHIRQVERCDEFTSLSTQKDALSAIIKSADSASLPDFLMSLQRYKSQARRDAEPPHEPSSPSASLPSSRLRYTAYEAPPPSARLRVRRSSSRASSQLSGSSVEEPLSRTVTAGDLTLAAAAERLEISSRRAATNPPDLIALNDSPFIADPSAENFESAWNALSEAPSARGWCDASIEDVIKRLERLEASVRVISGDETPFLDGSYLNSLALKLSEAVSRALAQPTGPSVANDVVGGKRPIPAGRGKAFGAVIASELAATRENPHLNRAILRSLLRPLSVLLSNLSAHLLPVISSPSFLSPPAPTLLAQNPNPTQLHALALAAFAGEVLDAFDELSLGLDGDARGDGLKVVRDGLVSIVNRVVTPLAAGIKAEILPLLDSLETPNSCAHSTKIGSGAKNALVQHPSITALVSIVPVYARALRRYTPSRCAQAALAPFLISVVWRGLVALAHRPFSPISRPPSPKQTIAMLVPKQRGSTSVTPPVTPPSARFTIKLPPSRPPSPPALQVPASTASDARVLCELLGTLPRPESAGLANEAIVEAFDGLKSLPPLLEALQVAQASGAALTEEELEALTEELPTLVALSVLLNAYDGGKARSVADMLGLSEAEYRKGCLSGFGRADECAGAVGQRILDVMRQRGDVPAVVVEWLAAEMADESQP